MKFKTIAMIMVNRSGAWVDNLESLQYEREFKMRPGAWVGQMGYEKENDEWKAVSVIITHGSALTLPSADWEELPEPILSSAGVIGVRDLQTVRNISNHAVKRVEWVANVKKGIGNRDFAEFDNFFAFKAPSNTVIHPAILKNRNGDVVSLRLSFGERIDLQ